jgi:hypothetical protein
VLETYAPGPLAVASGIATLPVFEPLTLALRAAEQNAMNPSPIRSENAVPFAFIIIPKFLTVPAACVNKPSLAESVILGLQMLLAFTSSSALELWQIAVV